MHWTLSLLPLPMDGRIFFSRYDLCKAAAQPAQLQAHSPAKTPKRFAVSCHVPLPRVAGPLLLFLYLTQLKQ
jgi:hypothetical protein